MRRKTVLVLESGRIPELNVNGPISRPTRINLVTIANMVKHGRNVVECDPDDPHNTDKRITLTTENVGKDNFSNDEKAEKMVSPVVETPVQDPKPVKVEEPKKEEVKTEVVEPTPAVETPVDTEAPEAAPAEEPAKAEVVEPEKKPANNKKKNKNK